jgi:hypothetical protein
MRIALGCRVANLHRENTLKIQAGDDVLYPDAAYQIITPNGQSFNFFVELDRSTERIRSTKDADSWERKLRAYDRWQQQSKSRARVLIVMVNDGERLAHVLDIAARIAANPERSLFYGVALAAYSAESKPLTSRCFRDHRGRSISLIPRHE